MSLAESAYSMPPRQAIEACRALTASMVEHAAAGRWSQAMRLEDERRQCFQHAWPDTAGQDDPAVIQEAMETLVALKALVALDQRLNKLAVEARQSALDDLRSVRGKAAASARYYESSGHG